MRITIYGLLFLGGILAACGDNNSSSDVTVLGDDTKAKTKVLETGTALLHGKQMR